MSPSAITPADASDTRDWVALSASLTNVGFQAPSGFPVTLNASALNVNLNLKASDGTYVNFSAHDGGRAGGEDRADDHVDVE